MLTMTEKTVLALRIVSARFLDDLERVPEVFGGLALLQEAQSTVDILAKSARRSVKDLADAKGHLIEAARLLRALNVDASGAVKDAAAELDAVAQSICDDGGEGPVFPSGSPQCCHAGTLALLSEIEHRVRGVYEHAVFGTLPTIIYVTDLIENEVARGELQTTGFAGSTDIRATPRIVRLQVRDCTLSSAHLCEFLYVAFHEVTCHGFQASRLASAPNAHPTCTWTEGWMDALAVGLAKDFATRADSWRSWLQSIGCPSSLSFISARHELRYEPKTGFTKEQARLRRAARDAYWVLRRKFLENGMARDEVDANGLVIQFSTLANAGDNPSGLRNLSAMLTTLLLNRAIDQSVFVCAACIEYIRTHDFSKLVSSLTGLLGLSGSAA